jgi:hypothetical protein
LIALKSEYLKKRKPAFTPVFKVFNIINFSLNTRNTDEILMQKLKIKDEKIRLVIVFVLNSCFRA